MDILYKSTRGEEAPITASGAVIQGLSPDGGLFVPTSIPKLNLDLSKACDMTYKELALHILKEFLSDFTEDELQQCIDRAYDDKFDTEDIAPVVRADNRYFLELFHGPTIAFKDMALSILPHLLTIAARKNKINDEIIVLTATSGDTGKAALTGFADVPGTKIMVFYPEEGVSNIQRLQMVTQRGDNTKVVGVRGNFDDCQNAVKRIFADKELNNLLGRKGLRLSSANSINIGRLVPQVVYYVWAYLQLMKTGQIRCGDKINFVVPTGNFGNILAGYYAKLMGLPVNKLICASNDNKVLFDFFRGGTYDKNREFILTNSPSMDILISSNLERLIYMVSGEDAAVNARLMSELATKGKYTLPGQMKERLTDFHGEFATQQEALDCIARIYEKDGYVIDTHTAVAVCAHDKYKDSTGDDTPSVIVSTASPFKFLRAVLGAINPEHVEMLSEYDMIYRLDMLMGKKGIPGAIKEILALPIRHKDVCDIERIEDAVKGFLNIA
ncbi:MAG: threonine synthase [Lachnospiraceae bacterium]|jgi:threonine synthase